MCKFFNTTAPRNMRKWAFLLFWIVFASVRCDGERSFHESNAEKKEHIYDHIRDKINLDGQAMRHLKDHLKNVMEIDEKELENAGDTQAIYYLFKLHDFDGNQLLDGLELTTLFSDYRESAHNDDVTAGEMIIESEVAQIVDTILEEHDVDGDGYVNWPEMASQSSKLLLNRILDT